MEPVRPEQVQAVLPDEVIEAANHLIISKWNGKQSVFTTDELADGIEKLIKKRGKQSLLKRGEVPSEWLDIEDTYRTIGWKVVFKDHGGMNTTPDYYTFTKKKR